jgi:hypothetical protein
MKRRNFLKYLSLLPAIAFWRPAKAESYFDGMEIVHDPGNVNTGDTIGDSEIGSNGRVEITRVVDCTRMFLHEIKHRECGKVILYCDESPLFAMPDASHYIWADTGTQLEQGCEIRMCPACNSSRGGFYVGGAVMRTDVESSFRLKATREKGLRELYARNPFYDSVHRSSGSGKTRSTP